MDHGHPFHLYVYGDVENVPAGTVVRHGTEILPAREIFCYQRGHGKGSVAAFSDCFRYKLLLERGGWWSDMDVVCMRPLNLPEEHVLGYERAIHGGMNVGTGVMKAPAGSPLTRYCWQRALQADRARLVWGDIGPRLVTEAVGKVDVPVQILGPAAFYPIDAWRVRDLVSTPQMPGRCYTVHLWHALWSREYLDPDAIYDGGCIYEQLKQRYGVVSPHGAAQGSVWLNGRWNRWRRLIAGLGKPRMDRKAA